MTQQDSFIRGRSTKNYQGRKLAIVGRLIPSIVHEINNPMQAIKGGVMLALEEVNTPQSVVNYLRIIESESDRVLGLTAFLHSLYSEKASEPTLVNLETMIEQCLRIMKDDLNRKGLQFEFIRPPTAAVIIACENDVQLALLDLWLNINTTLHNLGRRAYALSIIVSKFATMLEFSFDSIVQTHCQSDDEKSLISQNRIDVSFAEEFITPQGGKIVLEIIAEQSHLCITFPSAADPLH